MKVPDTKEWLLMCLLLTYFVWLFFRPQKMCNFLFKMASILWTANAARILKKAVILLCICLSFLSKFPLVASQHLCNTGFAPLYPRICYTSRVSHVVLGKFPASVSCTNFYQILQPLYLCFLLEWKSQQVQQLLLSTFSSALLTSEWSFSS